MDLTWSENSRVRQPILLALVSVFVLWILRIVSWISKSQSIHHIFVDVLHVVRINGKFTVNTVPHFFFLFGQYFHRFSTIVWNMKYYISESERNSLYVSRLVSTAWHLDNLIYFSCSILSAGWIYTLYVPSLILLYTPHETQSESRTYAFVRKAILDNVFSNLH